MQEKHSVKVYFSLKALFHLASDVTFKTDPPAVFNTTPVTVFESTNISSVLSLQAQQQLRTHIEEFQQRQSGWVIEQLLQLDFFILENTPLRGSSYIPLPKEIYTKRAVLNIRNQDDKCFLWSIIAAKHPCYKHGDRVSKYKEHEHTFNVSGISFPTPVSDIPKFERRNNMTINVFGYDACNKAIYPIRVVSTSNTNHADLLLISEGEKQHYCLIRNFSRLVGSQISKHDGRMYFCKFCLHGFSRIDLLESHEPDCSSIGVQKTIFPEDPNLKFTNIQNQLKAPFVIYADFEALLKPIPPSKKNDDASMVNYQKHLACSFSYHIVSICPEFDGRNTLYFGEDAADVFLDQLQKDAHKIMKVIKNPKKLVMSAQNTKDFEEATHCHISDRLSG